MFRRATIQLTQRRYASTSILNSQGPWHLTDFLSPTQAEHLDATLDTVLPFGRHSRLIGELTPPGYHLIYFNPQTPDNLLCKDGYESHQAPSEQTFPMRMWTGGSIEYNLDTMLKLGIPSRATETVADLKHSTEKGERVSVTIERKLRNVEDTHDFAIKESRTLMYFSPGSLDRDSITNRVIKPSKSPVRTISLTPSDILLFRYSALTFNSHRIHWDRLYAQQHEKLSDLVVQGPLMVTLMLRWISTHVLGPQGVQIKHFSYKNIKPAFVGRELKLCSGELVNGKMHCWIQDDQGSLVMTGHITLDTTR